MAKKKEEAGESNVFAEMLAAQRRKVSGEVYTAAELDAALIGVPIPGLSFMWLCGISALPVSKMYGVAGAPQASKSTLALEIGRWGQRVGGFSNLVEAEGLKYSAELQRSLIGSEYYKDRFSITPVVTLEEAQRALNGITDFYHAGGKDEQAAARKALCTVILDSLSGVENEGSIEKMDSEGAMNLKVSHNAKLWTEFFRAYTGKMVNCPLNFVVVNHLKDAIGGGGGYGPPPKTLPGGVAQRFHSAIYFYINRLSNQQDIRNSYYLGGVEYPRPHQEVRSLQIKADKSSFGMDGRKIQVELFFYHNESNEQVTYFDWDSSTCQLLSELQTERNLAMGNIQLSELCDISPCKAGRRNAWKSKKLGLEGAESHEIGKAIHENPDLMKDLKYFLRIKEVQPWTAAQ